MTTKKTWSRKKKIILIVLGSLLVLLIAIRIVLPYILLKFVNRELATIKGYYGHVDDIDVALIRGAYTIKKIRLDKTGGKIPVPFFSADVIDLSVEWSAIFSGALVGEKPRYQYLGNYRAGFKKCVHPGTLSLA